MAATLFKMITGDPSLSVIFDSTESSPEPHGQYLFIHHATQAICRDLDLDEGDEQARDMAMGIWDGLPAHDREFWAHRAATARLARDQLDFVLTDGSTMLSKDHYVRASDAFETYRQALIGDDSTITGVSNEDKVDRTAEKGFQSGTEENGVSDAEQTRYDRHFNKIDHHSRKSNTVPRNTHVRSSTASHQLHEVVVEKLLSIQKEGLFNQAGEFFFVHHASGVLMSLCKQSTSAPVAAELASEVWSALPKKTQETWSKSARKLKHSPRARLNRDRGPYALRYSLLAHRDLAYVRPELFHGDPEPLDHDTIEDRGPECVETKRKRAEEEDHEQAQKRTCTAGDTKLDDGDREAARNVSVANTKPSRSTVHLRPVIKPPHPDGIITSEREAIEKGLKYRKDGMTFFFHHCLAAVDENDDLDLGEAEAGYTTLDIWKSLPQGDRRAWAKRTRRMRSDGKNRDPADHLGGEKKGLGKLYREQAVRLLRSA